MRARLLQLHLLPDVVYEEDGVPISPDRVVRGRLRAGDVRGDHRPHGLRAAALLRGDAVFHR